MGTDRVFADPLGQVQAFSFDAAVARVFPDMLRRSIPGYPAIITQSGLLAARFATPGTTLYDLGCSLGATSLSLHRALWQHGIEHYPGCRIIGIDPAPAMIERGRAMVADYLAGLASSNELPSVLPSVLPMDLPIELQWGDMRHTSLEPASVIALNFTLQFIAPESRQAMMNRIADALVPGGVLILSEKITFDDAELQHLNTEMYHAFKRANGYSDLEISQKRTALENVLIPDTLPTHQQRLEQAGLVRHSVWFQCYNFVSMVAFRPAQ